MNIPVSQKTSSYTFPIASSVLIVGMAHFVFMLFSGKDLLATNPYNSYIRQALAWAQGQLYLPENYPWLELAVYEGHYYVSFPPFPSYLLFPFSLIFGVKTPDSLLSFIIMLIGVLYAVCIAKKCGMNDWQSILISTFLYCANNIWMVTVDAWVWFFAQNLAFTLTLMSFYYGLAGKFGKSLFFLAAAVGCRPFQILYLPIILIWIFKSELNSSENFKRLFLRKIYRFVPAILLGGSYMALNVLRFGDPFEFGHSYLPEFLRAEHGQFSLSYLPDNLHQIIELPHFDSSTNKLIFQQFNGTNIFIVFPIFAVFLFSFTKAICLSLRKTTHCSKHEFILICVSLCLVLVHVLLLCSHRTMGGAHFGNRYIIDTVPATYVALIGLTKSRKISRNFEDTFFALCYISGLLINFVGVLNFYEQ